MAKAKAAKKKPDFRHEVSYPFQGKTRYGVVAFDKAKAGHVFIDDAVLPFRVEVLDDASVVDIESSLCSKDNFPVYDRNTGALEKGGNDFDKFVNAEYLKAEALSKAAGKGVVVNKLFSIGVADGRATYIVTKVKGNKVDVEWRGFGGGDRYTDHFFGYGKKNVSKADVAKYIRGEEGWNQIVKDAADRDRAIIESQPVGAFIHYIESRAEKWPQFVRYQIVEKHGGVKVAQFVGICGTWPDHALPHRTAWGGEYMDHKLTHLLKNPMAERLCASYVWESAPGDTADVKRSVLPDPHTLPLIDLTMPAATPEQVECGRLNDMLQAVRDAVNGKDAKSDDFNSDVAQRRLIKAFQILGAEFGDG